MPRPDHVALFDVTRRYRTRAGGTVDALRHVDLQLPQGVLAVVAGPTGSGKSTLLSMIACTDRPDEGSVIVDDVVVNSLSRRRRRAFRRRSVLCLLSQPSENLLERYSAAENVAWAARVRGREGADPAALFEQLHLSGVAHKRVRQLSGGEQQRVAIAAAVAAQPSTIAADEPTASLDAESAGAVVAALRLAVSHGSTVIVASHDPGVIAAADVVVHLRHGEVAT